MKKIFVYLFCIFATTSTFCQQPTIPINRSITSKNTNFELLLNSKDWNTLFPNRNKFYSFSAFKYSARFFPGFLESSDISIRKRELAAFLANIAQETSGGWDEAPGGYFKWGLYFIEEQNKSSLYADTTKIYFPPVKGVSYHGRGPKQLSWNYNYGQFSLAWFGNKDILLNHPELIATNDTLAFASSLWFWMTAQPPKPSCHQIMSEQWTPTDNDLKHGRLPGFGATINVINGGVECGKGKHFEKTKKRYQYYIFFCKYFKVSPGQNINCENQDPFDIR